MSTLPGEPRRTVLVIANETCASAGVAEELAYRARGGAQVVVVAPALARSRLGHWLSSDLEGAQASAEQRLAESLESLRAAGLEATGYLGDADPLQALDDALRVHAADEVIISTHPPQRSNWLERQVVRRARERYAVPITHIVVDVALEGTRTEEDGRLRPAPLPERRLRLFHRSDYDEAIDIRERGFHDSPAPTGGGAGVLVSDRPGAPAAGGDAVIFEVELPEAAAAGFEREPAEDGARRFVVPAELLNRHGPVAVGDWSE
jgi:hypothetical protein